MQARPLVSELCLRLVPVAMPVGLVDAQDADLGTWTTGFDHSTAGPAAQNDFLSPFSGQPGYVPPPTSGWFS